MAHFLVVDFGTSSTKAALVDLDSGRFQHLRRYPALATGATAAGRHEVALTAIRERFDNLCGDAWRHAADGFEGICLCSEMHGFAVLDPATGAPLTPYVSWLDARALEPVDGTSTFELVTRHLGDDFRRRTGMRPRPGFPLINLIHCARTMDLPRQVGVVSLPGWLACDPSATALPPEHPTILAGMAFYDVVAGDHAPELLATVRELGGVTATLGEVADETTVAGHWRGPGGHVPIFAGLGDHQCSVLGAGLVGPEIVSINLGTGSQVSSLGAPATRATEFEHRPFVDGEALAAVTHIPAGRALNEFVGFLERIAACVAGGTAPDFWQLLAEIAPSAVTAAPLDVDLAVFDGARGFEHGGRIGGILEGSLTPGGYLASVLRAFAQQYVDVLTLFDARGRHQRLVLSGGIARNLPHLAEILAAATQRPVDGAANLDESLLGLRAAALRCAGRAPSVAAAWRLHGRECEVIDE